MSVTCQDLLTLKYFERIKLVAGPNGLDRTVTWPYVGQTSTVSQWVHGGELLFITGIVHSADKLKDLILECIQKKLAGLVILVGNEYINSIPEELLAQADAADFPLFEMPWDVKLIDVTREITDLIMRDKFEIKSQKTFWAACFLLPMLITGKCLIRRSSTISTYWNINLLLFLTSVTPLMKS